jgi:hypothetical protein
MKRLIFSVLMFTVITTYAQTEPATVKVNKDARIDLLLKKQVEANEIATRDQRSSASGFRILVLNTTARAKAVEAKTKMYREFPELKSYLTFQSPKFHLKVGNFRSREEAETYLESIRQFFPAGVYVVRDRIEVNPVPGSDTTEQ